MIREIAGPEPLLSPDICSWADRHRNPATGRFHYVNIPLNSGHYDAARDCPGGACAVAELERAAADLARSRDPQRQLQALRWLVHVVADLHQPLHAGDGWDRGGNDLRVRLGHRREPTNLHKVWDVEVLKPLLSEGGPLGAARILAQAIRREDVENWSRDLRPSSWAEESNAVARAIYAELGVSPTYRGIVTLPAAYATRQRGRVEARLECAGVRLAAILNRVAAERVGLTSNR
jgi:hypothetical protein